jgi:hypothetical protein
MTEKKKSRVPLSELKDPDLMTIFEIIKNAVLQLRDKTAIILWSSFILLILWGAEGNLKVFTNLLGAGWIRKIFPNVAWGDQLATFIGGFVLLVVIPCLIIKFRFREKLSEYGLGWPRDRIKLGLLSMAVIMAIGIPVFYFGTFNPEMQHEYPLFGTAIQTWPGFIVYEVVYLLFFITIEFIFRGYLLFGLYGIKDVKALKGVRGIKGPLVFGMYAVLIQMLTYTMWHISKPVPELLGTIVWGVAVAAVALKIRSIWPIIITHWLLNVFVDVVLWIKNTG